MLLVYLVFLIHYCCCIRANTDVAELLPALYTLDDYASCLQGPGDVYCVVQAKVVGGNNQQLLDKIKKHTKVASNFDYYIYDRAVCVTKLCRDYIPNSSTLKPPHTWAVLQTCVNNSFSKQYGVSTSLSDAYACEEYGETRVISWKSWMVIYLLAAIVALNLVGTCCHFFNIKGKLRYIEEFSIPYHWDTLISRPEGHEKSRYAFLNVFDGARVVLLFITMIPHATVPFSVYSSNPEDFEQAAIQSGIVRFLTGGLSIVQVYFGVSGFLTAYILEIESEKRRLSLKHYPVLLIYRWLRLALPYVLVLLVTAYLFPLLGSGPLWKFYSEGVPRDCENYFWHHIFFTNNYEPNDLCLIQTWHIAADMQVFTVGLLVYLWATPPRRPLALLVLAALGLAIPAHQIWRHDFEGATIMRPELPRALSSVPFRMFHIRGHNNLSCFTMGMLTGLAVHRWRFPLGKVSPLVATLCRASQWAIIPLYVATLWTVAWVQFPGAPRPASTRIAYNTALQLALGGIFALMMLSIANNVQSGIRRLMEWRGFRLPAGVSYCAYLLHLNPMYYWIATRRELVEFTLTNYVVLLVAIYVASIIIAIPLYIMVEAPINALVKQIFARSRSKLVKKEKIM